jgi:hypothetical protein
MKPTLEEYTELGIELSFLCSRMQSCSIRLAELTGTSKAPYMEVRKASSHLDRCKSEAEELLFEHYPKLEKEGLKIFYGEIKLPRDLQKAEQTV